MELRVLKGDLLKDTTADYLTVIKKFEMGAGTLERKKKVVAEEGFVFEKLYGVKTVQREEKAGGKPTDGRTACERGISKEE